ncbi:MAG: glycoside hydrolase family 3 C-terminal domain-containing protein [Candidatus Heimdallarchaeota archaeon]
MSWDQYNPRIAQILSDLTLKEKIKLLAGRYFFSSTSIKRLGIKTFRMTDGPNGVAYHSSVFKKNTMFPTSISLGATWNRELAKECGIATGKEVRAINQHMILAPGINIGRTPLNGRTFEYFSEDPYLTKEMAIPFVIGVQSQRIGVCVKHYVANNQETNRFTVSAVVDERTLNEIYLEAFRQVVLKADPWSVMGCYNKVNGIYGCEHIELLRETLFEKWGFNGFVVSDWFATRPINGPVNAVKAGLSLEMPIRIIYKQRLLKKAIREGKITEEDIDFLIERFLRVQFMTGMYDPVDRIPTGERNTKEHQDLARKIAEEGIVLLKNDNDILPLDITKITKIMVVGPNAKKKMGKFLYGGSMAVVPPYEITPVKGIKMKCKGKATFVSEPKKADIVIVVVGLNHDKYMDYENADKKTLDLPLEQIELIKETAKINPNTIVVLINGSPIKMQEWMNDVPAILEAWYPGMEGGNAIANVLFGDVNPSGKLPHTFPKELSDSPAHKSERTFPGMDKVVHYEEGIFVGYRHFDKENIEPLFPFGFGLSYTEFTYENLQVDKKEMIGDETLQVSVEITNRGNRAGAEVVQLYITDPKCSVVRPEKELKGFEKVNLEAKETKTVTITLESQDLAFYDVKTKDWLVEDGKFTIHVGKSSRDIIQTIDFKYKNK